MQFQQIRGATAIITFNGKRFLIDPFFADKGTLPPIPSPYNNSPNPLVNLPMPKSEIVNVDAVIVTHMHHFDHFDKEAADALCKNIPMFTQNVKETQDMKKLGFTNVVTLLDEGVSFKDITLYRTEAEHGHGKAAEKNYVAFGIPSEASGVVFKNSNEKTLYIAGDTLWNKTVKAVINKYKPEVIVLNAAHAQFADGTAILMGTDGLYEVYLAATKATIIVSHLNAVNHALIGRKEMKQFVQEKEMALRVFIPEDKEIINC